MNKVFKVIWSEARNAYVVVSEIAKNHGSKSCSTKKLLTMLIATGVMTCASMAPAMAAPNVDASATVNVGKKAAVNVAENAKVNVKKDAKVNVEESAELTVKNGAKVTFSKDAGIGFENGAKINLGSKAGVTLADGAKLSVAKGSNVSVDKNITMGNGAVSSPYVGQTGNVAIGEKALAWNGNGLQEALMDFGQGGAKVKTFFGFPYGAEIVDGTKLPGSIAIGKNTVARSGSTMIGDHGYTGKIGDTTITPDGNGIMKYNNDVYSTTIGANSFNSGALASVTGVFSIASSKFDGGDSYKSYAVQNTGATIYGSMNSIESATSDAEYSGIASSVLGFANKTQNANAALIWGTGNEVTNSIEKVGINTNWNNVSVAEAQKKAIEAMQSSDYAGGSVMAIGGGNKADYAKYSQLTGVKNKVTGTEAKAAQYDFVNGYQNTVTNASDVTVIGIKNEVTADGNKVIGDNHKVSGKDNVIFGSADEVTETTVNNAVVLGHNAKVIGEGGVALGSGSVASTAAGVLGYGADGKTDATWQATKGAVSVGGNGVTRQITNVAAGTADTDAVNVAQLKKVNEEALKHSTVTDDGVNITVTDEGFNADGGKEYKVALKNDIYLAGDDPDAFVSISGSKGTIWTSGKVTAGSVEAGSVVMDGATATVSGLGNKTTAYAGFATTGKAATEEQLKEVATEAGKHTTLVAGDNVQVKEEKTDNGLKYTVSATDTTYTAGNGIAINGENNAISVKLNKDEANLAVDKEGLSLNKDLKGIESISNNTSKLVLREGWAGMQNGVGASVFMVGGLTTINDKVTVDEQGKISGVATGVADTDAVNVGQLNKVSVEAGKHTTLVAGDNVQVKEEKTDNGLKYTVSATDTTYTAGNGIAINGENNAISVKLNKDEANLAVDKEGLSLNKDLKGIESISNNTSKLVLREGWAGMQNGVGASVFMVGGLTTINGRVTVDEQGKISGVAAGVADNDAVNVSQLNKVSVEAGKHTTLSDGKNTTVTSTNKDGQIDYQVNVAGDLKDITSVSNGASKINLNEDSISISNDNKSFAITNSGIGMSYIGADYAAKSIMLGENGTTISGGLNVAGSKITGVAAGTADTDAVNVSQLNKVSVEAGKHSVVTEGANITVTPEQAEDGRMQYNVALKNDIALAGDNDAFVNISGSHGSIWASSSVAAGNVIMDGTTATVSGLGNTTTAYDGFANGEGKAATEEQLKEVSKVAENANQGWNLSTNGGKASKVAPGETVDFSGDKNITISNDGTNVKVKLNENIDVNSVQTNALNSKYNLSVGTMAENGIMPFFVNSTGDFYAAHNKFHVDKDGKVTATAGEIGNVVLQNGVYYGHSTLQDGSLLLTDDNGNHSYIDAKGAKLGKVTVAEDGKITGVAAGAITADSTDAVNGSQLHAVATEAGKHSKVVNGSNINVEEFDNDGQKIYKVNLNKDIMLGDLTGKYVSISGTNGTIETTGYIATEDRVYADKGGKLADIDVTGDKISNGASSIVLDGSNVKVNDKVTIDQNGKISGVAAGAITADSTDAINGSQLHQTNENVAANRADIDKNKADIAALDNRVTKNEQDIKQNAADIAQNKADIATNKADIATNKANIAQNAADIKKVEELAKKHTTVTAGDNITVTEDTNKDGGKEYKVALDKDIKLDSVTTGQTVMNNDGLKVGKDVSVTATAVTAGKTSISDEGVKVGDKTYISDKGLNANDQKVTNVKAGDISETSKDAVNGSQLYKTNQEVANNTNRINQLGSRVNKVGAGAAALAALHPMDFDPDDKLTFSAGYGNYGGENAAAIGAYYRPDEKVMFSVGGTVGNGENMVNAGVSFSLDRTNHVSNSRTALAREVIDLRGQLAVMGAKMAKMEKAFGMLDETKTKLFPDIPANHWAYEYIAKLAGNGYIEGYPDGNFGGDRLMTRYEFAAMLYRAIENGAALEEKIIKEFEPELGRIRVDRISGEDGDRDKIERVRVNDTKGERDHYGNKLAK